MSGFFNKMFDMNHDGKLDAGEQFLEFMMFNEMMKEENQSVDDWGFGADDDSGSDWQESAEENILGIDPYDFDSEEEYNDAVAEKEAWTNDIPDEVREFGDDRGIFAEDYDSYDDFADALRDEI